VGISSLFTAYSDMALATAAAVRRHLPEARIVVGGHHPTALPESVMACPDVDFAIRGEGEAALPALAEALSGKMPLNAVPGLVWRKLDGGLHIGAPAAMDDPGACPLPALDLIHPAFYRRHGRAGAVVVASRGCPMRCSYCCVARGGLSYRRKTVEAVLAEIQQAVDGFGAGFIDFEDENISLDREWFLRLLSGIRTRFAHAHLELRAMNGLMPASLDPGVIDAMRETGFTALNLSLCTTSPRQLVRFQRPDMTRAVREAVGHARSLGMETVCYLIVGGPGQRAEDGVSDLLFLAGLNALAGVSVYYPAPGSREYALALEAGSLPSDPILMRSTALPVSGPTTRVQAVTLLRLSRILNFARSLRDAGIGLPGPADPSISLSGDAADRQDIGIQLLAGFLRDGRIRGVTPNGDVYDHAVDETLVRRFLSGWADLG